MDWPLSLSRRQLAPATLVAKAASLATLRRAWHLMTQVVQSPVRERSRQEPPQTLETFVVKPASLAKWRTACLWVTQEVIGAQPHFHSKRLPTPATLVVKAACPAALVTQEVVGLLFQGSGLLERLLTLPVGFCMPTFCFEHSLVSTTRTTFSMPFPLPSVPSWPCAA